MSETSGDNQRVAERARALVEERLREIGATTVKRSSIGRRKFLLVTGLDSSRSIAVFVKAKTSGDWQASIRDVEPERVPRGLQAFWVFVDIGKARDPSFFVVPDDSMRRDIDREHSTYIARHDGVRPETPDSPHHKIQPRRVEHGRSRWDLLGLGNQSPLG